MESALDPRPLDLAVMRGASAVVVAALLRAHPQAATISKQGGLLALHLAARHGGEADVLAALLAAHPQAARQREMQSCMLPLHIAAANRADDASIRVLLEAHPDGAAEPDERGMPAGSKGPLPRLRTPLHAPAWSLRGLNSLPGPSEHSLSSWEACRGRGGALSSSPELAPKMATDHCPPAGMLPLHLAAIYHAPCASWWNTLSDLFDDPAPSARLVPPGAQAAPTYPRAQPGHLGSLRCPQHLASSRPKLEDSPPSTNRCAVVDALLLAYPEGAAEHGATARHPCLLRPSSRRLTLTTPPRPRPPLLTSTTAPDRPPPPTRCSTPQLPPPFLAPDGVFEWLPLSLAAKYQAEADVMVRLLAAHPDAAREADENGMLPLHVAAIHQPVILLKHALHPV